VVRDGAANSHAAIMVRALGIPTVMGADIQPSVLHRRTLVVDGYRGELLVDPEPVLLQEYQRLISEENELSKLAEDDVNLPAQLKSGERVKVMLNAGLSPEHEEKLGSRIDGIGLYRTEIPFMLQSGFPLKRSRWRSIRACCRCLTTNRSPCVPWTSARINSCRICRSAKRTRAWAGAGSALRSISRRSS
jgi:signal transduction protein with GAF and PtsI domain